MQILRIRIRNWYKLLPILLSPFGQIYRYYRYLVFPLRPVTGSSTLGWCRHGTADACRRQLSCPTRAVWQDKEFPLGQR